MKIIDSHQHVLWWGRDIDGLVSDMDEHGIDQAWLLTWEVPPWEDNNTYHKALNPINARSDGTHAGIPLCDLIETRNRYPERFVLGYCPHPLIGNAPALLEAAVGIHKVRVCGEWKFRVLIDDPRSINLFRKAGELGLPVVLHLDVPFLADDKGGREYQPRWYGGTIDNLARAMRACPDTTFIGHAPGFWREISGDADQATGHYPTGPITPGGRLYALFDEHPNLVADLSAGSALRALQRDAEHAKAFIERYADRLLFARDYYGGDLHEFLQTLNLDESVKTRIYHANAERLLGDG